MSFHLHAHVGIKVVLPEHCASLSGDPSRYLLGISQCTLKIDKTYEAHSRHNSRYSTGKRKRKIRLYIYLSHMTLFLSSIIGDRILDCYFGHNTGAVTESSSICNLVFFTFHSCIILLDFKLIKVNFNPEMWKHVSAIRGGRTYLNTDLPTSNENPDFEPHISWLFFLVLSSSTGAKIRKGVDWRPY